LKAKSNARYAEDITGKVFMLVGEMVRWPAALGGDPVKVIRRRGGTVVEKLSPEVNYLVLSSRRAGGKAAAHRKAQKLNDKGAKIQVVDDAVLAHLLRPKLESASFYVAGGFNCCPGGEGPTHPRALVQTVGGVVHDTPTDQTQFGVIGERRAAGKADAERLIAPFVEAGSMIRLGEAAFLELISTHRPPGRDDGLAGLFVRLQTLVDPKKLERALKMLKAERMQLFAEATPQRIIGIVRSQRSDDVYACHLASDGTFGCRTMDLSNCMGLGGSSATGKACKHLVVLVMGLVHEGLLSSQNAEQWMSLASTKGVSSSTEASAEAILRYKGVQAGEMDWRPIETIPEDYYAM